MTRHSPLELVFAIVGFMSLGSLIGGCRTLDAAYAKADADTWNSIGAEHEAFVAAAVSGLSPDAPLTTLSGYKTTAGNFYRARAAWEWSWYRRLRRAHADLGLDASGLRAPLLKENGPPEPPPVPSVTTPTATPAGVR